MQDSDDQQGFKKQDTTKPDSAEDAGSPPREFVAVGQSRANSTLLDSTATSTSLAPPGLRPFLIYVGSAENGFKDAGKTFDLNEVRRVNFGRTVASGLTAHRMDEELEVRIPLAWVSGSHATLELRTAPNRPASVELTDLGSRNGTTIEGVDLPGRAPLDAGQVFEIGRSFWMVRHATTMPDQPASPLDLTGTASPVLARIFRNLERLSESRLPLLLSGETGTGKAHLARAIHAVSRPEGNFVPVNMLNLSTTDLLLGDPESDGLLRRANGGTIYIDELSGLDRDAQTKLGCLLSYTDGDGDAPNDIDIRIIASSARDIRPLVETGEFRSDLCARLSVYEAELPPLRDRREDIGLLLRALARDEDGKVLATDTAAFRRLLGHRWPFNVRELRQTLQALSLIDKEQDRLSAAGLEEVMRRQPTVDTDPAEIQRLREQLVSQLADHQGDTRAVASSLGRPSRDVETWLRRLELDPASYSAN